MIDKFSVYVESEDTAFCGLVLGVLSDRHQVTSLQILADWLEERDDNELNKNLSEAIRLFLQIYEKDKTLTKKDPTGTKIDQLFGLLDKDLKEAGYTLSHDMIYQNTNDKDSTSEFSAIYRVRHHAVEIRTTKPVGWKQVVSFPHEVGICTVIFQIKILLSQVTNKVDKERRSRSYRYNYYRLNILERELFRELEWWDGNMSRYVRNTPSENAVRKQLEVLEKILDEVEKTEIVHSFGLGYTINQMINMFNMQRSLSLKEKSPIFASKIITILRRLRTINDKLKEVQYS